MSIESRSGEVMNTNSRPAVVSEAIVSPKTPTQTMRSQMARIAHGCPAGSITFKVGQKLAEVEREMILRTVAMTCGNRTHAAKYLGITARTLYSKLLQIDRENQVRAATPTALLPKVES